MAGAVAGASLGATALGGITGAVGSIFGGQSQSAMYQYQAGIAAMNAQIAKQNAAYETAVGETRAQESGMKTRAQIGSTRAQQGASGLDVNSGTNVSVRASEAELGNFEQSIIRSDAARRAYGQEVVAAQETAQSQVDMMAADNAKTAGLLGGFTSILGGASSFGSKYLQFQQLEAI
jgi:hypothetical protein